MKPIHKLSFAIILTAFNSSCNSAKTIVKEKLNDSTKYEINFFDLKKKEKQQIIVIYGKKIEDDNPKEHFRIKFHYGFANIENSKFFKVFYNSPKELAQYLLTDKSNFDIPLSEIDVFLLNKLKPIVDSLHFPQSNLIKNAKGFKFYGKKR